MGKAIQDLKKEHTAILNVLEITDHVLSSQLETDKKMLFGEQLVYFLKTFADQCHHGKEENYLFPVLEKLGIPKQGGPIGVMLIEHQMGREYLALISQAVIAADPVNFQLNANHYAILLRSHIEKENNVLFVMADRACSEAKQDELYKQFEQFEETVMGAGVHEKLHAMIHQWTEDYLSQGDGGVGTRFC
ncbi:MAG: hemerythrin domain-containing protein [Negativicutes bacterium]|nr:hemerythrin domain-containing protein [Negativicutes bacterium]